MRPWMLFFALILIAGPCLAAGTETPHAANAAPAASGPGNRYQANWTPAAAESTRYTASSLGAHSTSSSHDAPAPSNRYQAAWSLAAPQDDAHEPAPVEHHAAAPEHEPAETVAADPRIVEMPILVTPVIVNGQLVNYAFVAAQLSVSEGHDPLAVRARVAYLRDAMVRAAHRRPLNDPDRRSINPETAARVWTTAANQVLGEGVVEGVRVISSDLRVRELAGGR